MSTNGTFDGMEGDFSEEFRSGCPNTKPVFANQGRKYVIIFPTRYHKISLYVCINHRTTLYSIKCTIGIF